MEAVGYPLVTGKVCSIGKGFHVVFHPFSLRRTVAEISRARHIAQVLIRNGLGFLAERMGFMRFLPRWRARRMEQDIQAEELTVPQRVRHTLEELGPTFIKLGQVLSTRPDLLPPQYIVELGKLLDAAPPVPLEGISQTVQEELGAPLGELYQRFEAEPIASASIGQVHRAALHDSTEVAVKVQRPGIERTIETDLDLLLAQARFIQSRSETLKQYGLVDIVQEFAQSLRDELDYTIEGRHADRLYELLREENVLIPGVHWDLTTNRVITLDYLDGVKLTQVQKLADVGYDLHTVALQITQLYLRQVFVHGIFHADPHPANVLVCNGQIGLVDFGIIGYLTPQMKRDLGDLLFAVVQKNADEVVHIVTRIGAVGAGADRQALRRDVRRLILNYYNASLESVPIAQFLRDMMRMTFEHHIRLPPDLSLLVRTIAVLEGVTRTLDPSFVLAKYLEPFVSEMVRQRFSIKRVTLNTATTLRDLGSVLRVLPDRADSISEQLDRGELTVGIHVRQLTQAMRKLDAIGNRLSFSIIVAAIIVGSALILLGGKEAALFYIPFTDISLPIPQIGFILSALLGAWLLFSIVRSRGL
ncbi:MAG: AarF/ABC1/UbiB kinase family protein [Chloroflexota bacterium]|nr:AarF/ABC1/UbiB kinase family protein [Chloroflexota bacterium]